MLCSSADRDKMELHSAYIVRILSIADEGLQFRTALHKAAVYSFGILARRPGYHPESCAVTPFSRCVCSTCEAFHHRNAYLQGRRGFSIWAELSLAKFFNNVRCVVVEMHITRWDCTCVVGCGHCTKHGQRVRWDCQHASGGTWGCSKQGNES